MAIADRNEEIVLGWGTCKQATLGHKGESLPSNQVHTHPMTDQQLSRRVNPKEILTQGDLYEDVHCGTGNGDEWETHRWRASLHSHTLQSMQQTEATVSIQRNMNGSQ